MQMIVRNGSYRYGFQGQEMDDEVKGEGNSVNYKYRMHDPRVGRFFAVDPLARDYPELSPFSFSGNRVLDAVELEGLEPASIHLILVNGAGEVVYDNFLEAPGTENLGSYYLENTFSNMGVKSKDFALNSHVEMRFNVDDQQIEGLAESEAIYIFGNNPKEISKEYKWDFLPKAFQPGGMEGPKNAPFEEVGIDFNLDIQIGPINTQLGFKWTDKGHGDLTPQTYGDVSLSLNPNNWGLDASVFGGLDFTIKKFGKEQMFDTSIKGNYGIGQGEIYMNEDGGSGFKIGLGGSTGSGRVSIDGNKNL